VLKASDIWAVGVIIYMMLTGQPPFLGNSDEMIMDLIVIGDFTWPEEPVVSASARDLVESMLRLHHSKRITAAEALKHPWIQGAAASNKSLQSAKSSLQQFSAETLMKKAVSALLLKEFGEGDVNKLRQSFMELDIDGDRLLNERELAVYMSQHGFEDPKNARAAASLFIRSSAEMKEVCFFFSSQCAINLIHRFNHIVLFSAAWCQLFGIRECAFARSARSGCGLDSSCFRCVGH
jgi:serine/threonine protein kinase